MAQAPYPSQDPRSRLSFAVMIGWFPLLCVGGLAIWLALQHDQRMATSLVPPPVPPLSQAPTAEDLEILRKEMVKQIQEQKDKVAARAAAIENEKSERARLYWNGIPAE